MKDDNERYKPGTLVVYKDPKRFFTTEKEGSSVLGLVLYKEVDFFVKVLWTDGLCCLESLEDVLPYSELFIRDSGSLNEPL